MIEITEDERNLFVALLENRIDHFQRKIDAHERKELLAPDPNRQRAVRRFQHQLDEITDTLERIEDAG